MTRILNKQQLEGLFLHRGAFQSSHLFLCGLMDGSWFQSAETKDKLPRYLNFNT